MLLFGHSHLICKFMLVGILFGYYQYLCGYIHNYSLVPDTKTSIYVTAYHHRKLKKDFLGRIVISVSDVLSLYSASKSSAQEKIGYLFRNKSNLFDKDRGEVYISFDFVPIDFSVPSEPTSNSDPDNYTIKGVSKKDTPLFYSSLS